VAGGGDETNLTVNTARTSKGKESNWRKHIVPEDSGEELFRRSWASRGKGEMHHPTASGLESARMVVARNVQTDSQVGMG